MEIISREFLAFILFSLTVYYFLPRRAQNIWLLILSYSFLLFWGWQFAAILAIVTLFNFFIAWGVEKTLPSQKIWLVAGIGVNVLGLVFYRMADSGYLERLLSYLSLAVNNGPVYLHILLPIGFSFYAMQAISYQIDVSHGVLPASRSLVDFALYLAYFPKLLAGPIERAKPFLSALAAPRSVDNQRLSAALTTLLIGLLRKMILSEALLRALPDRLFYELDNKSASALLFYMIVYVFWLYNDFASYTGIVRGISSLFGIDLTQNFKQPLFSRSLSEFWNRWHISLSHLLRDYIYYPLSWTLIKKNKNKRNLVNTILPPMVTMLVSGLWHNFGFYMLVWGGLHGLYQSIEMILLVRKPSSPSNKQPILRQIVSGIVTFTFVSLAFVSFGSGSFTRAVTYWKILFTGWEKPGLSLGYYLEPGLMILITLLIDAWQWAGKDELIFLRKPRWVQACLLALVMILFTMRLLVNDPLASSFVYQGF